jgi:SAM-dependent methyltransferase
MTDEELMYSTPEEQEFWHKCVKGLPGLEGFSGTGLDKDGQPIPFGTGPHCIKAFRAALDYVQPKSILEIGFNLGYSSAVFLKVTRAKVVAVDISDKAETIYAAEKLGQRFKNRFTFILGDSAKIFNEVRQYKFDMIFIDGGHLEDQVTADLKLGMNLGIKYFLMDDWLPQFGPGVQVSIGKFNLELIENWGNIVLLKKL